MNWKGTKGEYATLPEVKGNRPRVLIFAGDHHIGEVEGIKEESTDIALLFVDAGNTIQQTGLLPSEMNEKIKSGNKLMMEQMELINDFREEHEKLKKEKAERTMSNARLLKQLKETTDVLEKVKTLHKKHYRFHKLGNGFIEESDEIINEAIQKSKELTNLSE